MSHHIHLDFETRSEADIRKVGAWRYAAHPSTEVMCLVYQVDDNHPILIEDFDDLEADILRGLVVDNENIFVAHNAFFERSVWENVMVPRLGFPEITPRQWRCTAAKAAMCALPRSLGGCGEALGLDVTKDDEGKRVMLKMAKPRPTWVYKGKGQKWFESPEDFKVLCDYCVTDVHAEYAIDVTLPDLPPVEQQVWFLDQDINCRGIKIDRDAVESALEILNGIIDDLNTELKSITNDTVPSATQRNKLLAWIREQGVETEGLTKNHVSELLSSELPDNVRRALEIRQQIGKTSTAKYQRMLDMMDPEDDRVRDILMYHGASTGRWSGKLVQVQNLPRGNVDDPYEAVEVIKLRNADMLSSLYGNPMDVISSCIRSMIIAEQGHSLYVADYSAIEARVLAWLANQNNTLEVFKNGQDVYIHAAAGIYSKASEQVSADERQIGKVAVLALGYQGGVGAFQSMASVYGVAVGDDRADEIKRAWRETHPDIVNFWAQQEQAALDATRNPGQIIEAGRIKWARSREWLACRLPSGRYLRYYGPEIRIKETPWGSERPQLTYMGVDSFKGGAWVRQDTYGGKLVENITQAVARDIMAEAMLRCESSGYPVVMTVHDEIICEVPDQKEDASMDQFIKLLTTLPDWAEGLPLDADGWKGPRYKK